MHADKHLYTEHYKLSNPCSSKLGTGSILSAGIVKVMAFMECGVIQELECIKESLAETDD